jgi:hypothetical protein
MLSARYQKIVAYKSDVGSHRMSTAENKNDSIPLSFFQNAIMELPMRQVEANNLVASSTLRHAYRLTGKHLVLVAAVILCFWVMFP